MKKVKLTAPVISGGALLVASIVLTLMGATSTNRDESLITLGVGLGALFGFVLVVLPYAIDGLRADVRRMREKRAQPVSTIEAGE